MRKPTHVFNGQKLKEIDIHSLRNTKPRVMRSSVTLPSQYQSYAICVQFAKEWFLEKFSDKYFNSVFVDGKHSFDEFRKFSTLEEKMTRTNPLLAIIPTIDPAINRNWIDTTPEIPMLLRRSRIEGSFFNDKISECNSIHLQIIFKTILMQFAFKMRVNTKAEQLDLCEFIKLKHRAGFTETRELCLDIHVPKEIIAQIAYDNGFEVEENLNIKKPKELLRYLNAHSLIPFIYKLRCSSGNNEFFIKVPNCTAHIRTELPSIDDGERQNMITTNYTIDFNVEIEMTAPYSYTYYSQCDQKFINSKPINSDGMIAVMRAIMTEIPDYDEHKWKLLSTTEYMVEEEDLKEEIIIDLNEYFKHTELKEIIDYTKYIHINPLTFMNFKIYNDGLERCYSIDWKEMQLKVIGKVENITTVIAVYCDMDYVNNTIAHLKDLESSRLH